MFVIKSKRDLDGMVHSFSNGRGVSGLCVFPTREMAEKALTYVIKHDDEFWGLHIKEVTDDYFYQLFLDIPENKHLKRDFKIDQINE